MSLENNINKFLEREVVIETLLSDSSKIKSNELADLSKELSDIKLITDLAKNKNLMTKELVDLLEILNDKSSDDEIKKIADFESEILKEKIVKIDKDIQFALLPKDKDDKRNVIIEVRAGTGGDEAGLFASNLFSMYQKFSLKNNWKFEVMEVSETNVGGYKEAQANIIGKGAFGRLKFESGVHRVQRVPATENSGRVHTSAATVAVLAVIERFIVVLKF